MRTFYELPFVSIIKLNMIVTILTGAFYKHIQCLEIILNWTFQPFNFSSGCPALGKRA